MSHLTTHPPAPHAVRLLTRAVLTVVPDRRRAVLLLRLPGHVRRLPEVPHRTAQHPRHDPDRLSGGIAWIIDERRIPMTADQHDTATTPERRRTGSPPPRGRAAGGCASAAACQDARDGVHHRPVGGSGLDRAVMCSITGRPRRGAYSPCCSPLVCSPQGRRWSAARLQTAGRRRIANAIRRRLVAGLLPRGGGAANPTPHGCAGDGRAGRRRRRLPRADPAPAPVARCRWRRPRGHRCRAMAGRCDPAAGQPAHPAEHAPRGPVRPGGRGRAGGRQHPTGRRRPRQLPWHADAAEHRSAGAPTCRTRRRAADLNTTTMAVVRRAFLSGAVMDVVITFSIAANATYIGLSLLGYVRLGAAPAMTCSVACSRCCCARCTSSRCAPWPPPITAGSGHCRRCRRSSRCSPTPGGDRRARGAPTGRTRRGRPRRRRLPFSRRRRAGPAGGGLAVGVDAGPPSPGRPVPVRPPCSP